MWRDFIQPMLFVIVATFVIGDDSTVYIQQFEGVVSATDADAVVSLPCNYTAAVKICPVIHWYRKEGDSKTLKAKIDKTNELVSYGDFSGRVGRGEKGALMIIRPNFNDSGHYICYVDISDTHVMYAKGPVILNVTQSFSDPPYKGQNEDDTTWRVAPLVVVSLGWSVAVGCAVLLTFQYMITERFENTQLRNNSRPLVIFVDVTVGLIYRDQ